MPSGFTGRRRLTTGRTRLYRYEPDPPIYALSRYTDDWCCRSPKNYQIWFHRRWLVDQVHARGLLETDAVLAYELDALDQLIELEPKHYNAWSHRLYLAKKYDLFSTCSEVEFAEKFIDLDVRNNSAWSYRRVAVRPDPSQSSTEIGFCLQKIRLAPSNESAWSYLRTIPGWESNEAVETTCEHLYNEAEVAGGSLISVFEAMRTLAQVYESRELPQKAVEVLRKLAAEDHIREPNISSQIRRILAII